MNNGQITRDQFASAKRGDKLEDSHGRQWEVLGNITHGSTPALRVKCPGHREEEVYYYDELGIVDEEVATIVELNEPEAKFIAA